jgi:glyoxylate/hydroxypyruvate reductase
MCNRLLVNSWLQEIHEQEEEEELFTSKELTMVMFVAGAQLKAIATMSVGYEHINLEDAKARKITISNTPNVSTDSVAETTVALLLMVARRVKEGR